MKNQKLLFLISFAGVFIVGSLLSFQIKKEQTYLPEIKGQLVEHTYFVLDYNETHEQANWVYYEVNKDFITGTAERKNRFYPDQKVSTGSASLADYKYSGYDRGHLCPSAIMKLNQNCNNETFLMSNMSPQLPCFNRKAWKNLETSVRAKTIREKNMVIVTGPIFPKDIEKRTTIGTNQVTVPLAFFKLLFSPKSQSMVAYIMNHSCESEVLTTNVDHVESITGIDFFKDLPDKLEYELEKRTAW